MPNIQYYMFYPTSFGYNPSLTPQSLDERILQLEADNLSLANSMLLLTNHVVKLTADINQTNNVDIDVDAVNQMLDDERQERLETELDAIFHEGQAEVECLISKIHRTLDGRN